MKLIEFNLFISDFFFYNFGMARVASQTFFFTKNDIFVFFWTILSFFHIFSKKTRIEILQRSVKFSARELRSEAISCIFG